MSGGLGSELEAHASASSSTLDGPFQTGTEIDSMVNAIVKESFPFFIELPPGTDQRLTDVRGIVETACPDCPIPEDVSRRVCRGFRSRLAYEGDCRARPQGTVCLLFDDGYLWLIRDSALRSELYSCGEQTVRVVLGNRNYYQHVLGTDLVKTTPR